MNDFCAKSRQAWFEVIRRWGDIFLLAVFASAIAFMIQVLLGNSPLVSWGEFFLTPMTPSWPRLAVLHESSQNVLASWYIVCLYTISSIISLWVSVRLNLFPRMEKHLHRNIWYPPTVLAGLFGFFIYWSLRIGLAGVGAFWIFWGLGFATVVICLTWLMLECLARIPVWLNVLRGKEDLEGKHDPFPWDEWFKKEIPITVPALDLFGTQRQAWLSCERILGDPMPTIALLGDYGSGKSSVVRLIQYYIENPVKLHDRLREERGQTHKDSDDGNSIATEDVIFCSTSLWGQQETLLSGAILEQMIQALGRHINVLSLARIPEKYQVAVSQSGLSWATALFHLTTPVDDPKELVMRIDRVLLATGLRMVVVIEDVERVVEGRRLPSHLGALINYLKDCTNIAFVIASALEDAHSVALLRRICEHAVRVKTVDPVFLSASCRNFRAYCQNLYPQDIVLSPQNASADLFRDGNDAFAEIVPLFETPRLFKELTKEVRVRWKTLHGEVDFTDLFLIILLEKRYPKLLVFLRKHLPKLAVLNAWPPGKAGTKKEDESNIERTDFERLTTQYERAMADYSKDRVFLDAIIEQLTSTTRTQYRCQSIVKRQYAPYLQRIIQDNVESAIPDQAALNALSTGLKDEALALSNGRSLSWNVLFEKAWALRYEQFGAYFKNDLLDFTGRALTLLFLEPDAVPERFKHYLDYNSITSWCPGILSLLNVADSCFSPYDDSDPYNVWIKRTISEVIDHHLGLTNMLYRDWYGTPFIGSGSTAYLVDEKRQLRQSLIAQFRNRLESTIGRQWLVNILNRAKYDELYKFVFTFSLKEHFGNGFVADDWIWLADPLVELCRENPSFALYLTAFCAFSGQHTRFQESRESSPIPLSFCNSTQGKALIESVFLLGEEHYSWLPEEDKTHVNRLIDEAGKWIEEWLEVSKQRVAERTS